MFFLIVILSFSFMLSGCGSGDSDIIVIFGGDTYTRKEIENGVTMEDGFYFDILSNEVHYVFYTDEMESSDLFGTWERDGNNITVTLEDGSTEKASISESDKSSSGTYRATKISFLGETYTSTSW